MPKLKTHSGAKKRFNLTKSGKVKRAHAFKSHILMIDKDPVRAEAAKNTLPVSVLKEDGSNPKILKEAIERTKADVILSSVPDDAINLFICVAAKNIKPGIRTIACIRNPDYMTVEMKSVDLLVSPESITAEKIIKMAGRN